MNIQTNMNSVTKHIVSKFGDGVSRAHSKRHGKAVKRGIAAAKRAKRSVLKAASRSRGKSQAEVAAKLFLSHTEVVVNRVGISDSQLRDSDADNELRVESS
jgi:hypothetical protein